MHQPSINLKEKKFNQYPAKVIWIQLAGFDEEQIAYLSLMEGEVKKGTFDAFTCIGMDWEFNANTLAPPSGQVMRSLLTGKSNINGSCDDSYQAPFWSYYPDSEDVRSVILEKSPFKGASVLDISSCPSANPSWRPNYVIRLDTVGLDKTKAMAFSVLQRGKLRNDGIYYDSSCNGDDCHNNLLTSISYVVDEVLRYQKRYVFVVKDFSAEKFLNEKNYVKWKEWLVQWNQVLAYLQNSLFSEETLILVTGVKPIPLQIPKEGQDIKNWLVKSTGATTLPRSIFGKTWAMGARSENFCGLYKAEDLVPRIFWQNNNKSLLGI